MKRYLVLAGLLITAGIGCKQKDGRVSNAATEYTSALQGDVQKAQAAAEKANQAIASEAARMGQAQEQTK
jgi:hypothetical protein